MSNSEDTDVNVVLETVTRTLRGLTTALEETAKSLNRHDHMFQNVEHNMGNFDDKARELQTKVYAQEQDIAELRRELESLKGRHETLARAHLVHSHGPYNA
jgi:chromosome segregation ATPase